MSARSDLRFAVGVTESSACALNGLGAALHSQISFTGLLTKTTKADTIPAKSTQAQKRPTLHILKYLLADTPATRRLRLMLTAESPLPRRLI